MFEKDKMAEESKLKELKKEYAKLKEKYELPEFEELNKEFEIEKLQEYETDILLKNIRKTMAEKVLALIHFLEFFINPTGAPMFILAMTRNLKENTKKAIEEAYKKGCEIEIKSLSIDLFYDEKKEIEFIHEFIEEWEEIKNMIKGLPDDLIKAWEVSEKKEKNYLG